MCKIQVWENRKLVRARGQSLIFFCLIQVCKMIPKSAQMRPKNPGSTIRFRVHGSPIKILLGRTDEYTSTANWRVEADQALQNAFIMWNGTKTKSARIMYVGRLRCTSRIARITAMWNVEWSSNSVASERHRCTAHHNVGRANDSRGHGIKTW